MAHVTRDLTGGPIDGRVHVFALQDVAADGCATTGNASAVAHLARSLVHAIDAAESADGFEDIAPRALPPGACATAWAQRTNNAQVARHLAERAEAVFWACVCLEVELTSAVERAFIDGTLPLTRAVVERRTVLKLDREYEREQLDELLRRFNVACVDELVDGQLRPFFAALCEMDVRDSSGTPQMGEHKCD